MKVEIEQVATCTRRLTIEVPSDRVSREFSAMYNDLRKRVRLPGFRPGKIPRSLLETYYGPSIEQEVLRKLVPEVLTEVLIKESVASVGEPQIDQITLEKDQPLRFVATTQVIPDFTLADYQQWTFERRMPRVLDTHVDQALENLRARHAILQNVEGRAAQSGDVVIVDYTGFLEGRPLPGAEGSKVSVELGTGQVLPELDQGMMGMEAGSAKMIDVRFPEDSRNADLAGKPGQFRVVVGEIKEKILPTADDEFARAYGDAESLAALRERLRQEIEQAMRQQADTVLQRDILARLVAEHPLEVPEVLVNDQMRRAYVQQKRQETGQEPTEADYQVDPAALREQFGEQALTAVRGQILLRRIGKEADLSVAPEEVDAEVASLAARMAQNAAALKRAMERNGTLRAIEANLLEAKIFANIMAHVQITDTVLDDETVATGQV